MQPAEEFDRAILKRLRELAAGEKPWERCEGICIDIAMNVGPRARARTQDILSKMGLDSTYPLGREEYEAPDLWYGDHGVLRRALARRVARWMEENLQFE